MSGACRGAIEAEISSPPHLLAENPWRQNGPLEYSVSISRRILEGSYLISFGRANGILHRLIVITVMLFFGVAGGQVAAQEAIGTVSRIQGDASGTNSGTTRALGLNVSVFRNEVVTTAQAARLEITFKDNTRLTLGAMAKLTLDQYIFDPAAGRRTIKVAVVGAFRFLSGQMSKLARSDVNVTTPVATIGIRGTEFWGGPIDDQPLGAFTKCRTPVSAVAAPRAPPAACA